MSEETRESPVWHDVVRVWTDPKGVAEDGLREGRRWPDWWRMLALYGLVTTFSTVFYVRIGADRIWDPIFGEPSGSEFSGIFFEIVIVVSILVCVVGAMFFQWLLLPKVSGWFAGSRSRVDASLTYYLFFAIAFLLAFVEPLANVATVLVERSVPHRGGYFSWVVSTIQFGVSLHQTARISVNTLKLSSYFRGLGVTTVSFFLGLFLSLLLVAAIILPVILLFPDLIGPPP